MLDIVDNNKPNTCTHHKNYYTLHACARGKVIGSVIVVVVVVVAIVMDTKIAKSRDLSMIYSYISTMNMSNLAKN